MDSGSARSDEAAPDTGNPSREDSGQETWETLTAAEFEQMTNEIARPLHATALRLTRNRDDAADLVQDTLFRGFRSLKSFRKGSRFRAWMFRILHNTFINRIRREQKAPKATDPTEMDPADVNHPIPDIRSVGELPDLADHHFDDQVKAAVDGLPENFRLPLVLFSLGALSYQEIADTLGIPIGTVMSRLHRGRKLLRAELMDYATERGVLPRGEA